MDSGKEDCKQTAQASRLTCYWGRKAVLRSGNPRAQRSGADGKAHSEELEKKLKKEELGSGKPYDE